MAVSNHIINKVKSTVAAKFFSNTNQRNKSVVKNIGVGFVTRGLSIFLSFLQIPIILTVLNKTEYGIWITLFSITGWFTYFDLGLGNGLRNKLTESLAENDFQKGKIIVSTTYVFLSFLFLSFVLIFSIAGFFVPWNKLLNAPSVRESELLLLAYSCFICTLLNFVAGLIQTIYAANHKTGKGNILSLCIQLLILAATLFVKYSGTSHPLLVIGIVLSAAPLIVNIFVSLYLFKTIYKNIAPSFRYFNKLYLHDVMSLGIKFFIIQIAVLVIFSTDNFLITQLFSPDKVTSYNIVYKYFSLIPLVFGIITTPLWTMYTDSYKRGDIQWITNNVNHLLKIFLLLVIAVIIMIAASGIAFNIWIGKDFNPSFSLVVFMGIYILQTVWNNIFVLPLNSIGKLDAQMYLSILAAIINIPLIIAISKHLHSLEGVVIANICSLLGGTIVLYFQYRTTFIKKIAQA
ncbi:lipopolysaccharide biosynthesis protein [Ferruginibacter albus]|uniref:lipopolysaccharide biosynthesis protein n=1 Tax=Ferruginibacter albus TaxID=2875540 RepID=UPI001CC6523B|nr:oligosaccharide flippase family protein [Ferruginibacter albus]UAY52238.1 oligosaccharide flippase family protein [Ferruginibacter albus]